jgi:transcription-repair coupling factor (superfamily II helicase)
MGASSDAMSLGPELESASQSVASHYFKQSQKHLSPAVSASIALDHSQAPIPSFVEEMGSEINCLGMTVNLMEKELLQEKAESAASNAHCTIMAQAATDAKAKLEQQKHKSHQSVKTSARYVTHPTIHARWAADQEERAQRAREAAQKEAQKNIDDAACNMLIQDDIQMKVFTGALHWYQRL